MGSSCSAGVSPLMVLIGYFPHFDVKHLQESTVWSKPQIRVLSVIHTLINICLSASELNIEAEFFFNKISLWGESSAGWLTEMLPV